jgi:hypothetical protein
MFELSYWHIKDTPRDDAAVVVIEPLLPNLTLIMSPWAKVTVWLESEQPSEAIVQLTAVSTMEPKLPFRIVTD